MISSHEKPKTYMRSNGFGSRRSGDEGAGVDAVARTRARRLGLREECAGSVAEVVETKLARGDCAIRKR
jgi:hypothetical protein